MIINLNQSRIIVQWLLKPQVRVNKGITPIKYKSFLPTSVFFNLFINNLIQISKSLNAFKP